MICDYLFIFTIKQICFNARGPDLIIIVPLLHFLNKQLTHIFLKDI